ncbi:MAG: iron chelate uptake ABC transporter family permease subunit [Thermoleophilia bacterium]
MGWLIDLLPLSYTDAVVVWGAAVLGVAAGVLGAFAVLPGRSLVGDALAHSALPGVAIAFLVTGAKDPASLLVGAAIAGLIGALMMVGIERTSRIRPDAAIGVVLSSFFSLGVVLLTYIGSTGDAQQAGLETYLFGQAAGLLEQDVQVMAILAAAAVAIVAIGFRPLKVSVFDRAFAASVGLPVRVLELLTTALLVVAIVIGLRAVGAILMVAMLIVPTVAARQLTHRLALLLPLAGVIGAAVGVTGALLSSRAEVPTGPVIVLVGVLLVLAAVMLAPGRGVVWRAAQRARERRAARANGVLIDLETALHAGPPPTEAELALAAARPRRDVHRGLRDLDRAGLIVREDGRVRLSEPGAAAAHAALERRRLWSVWLEHGWRLDMGDAREPDPRDVRGSLGDDLTDRLLAFEGGTR